MKYHTLTERRFEVASSAFVFLQVNESSGAFSPFRHPTSSPTACPSSDILFPSKRPATHWPLRHNCQPLYTPSGPRVCGVSSPIRGAHANSFRVNVADVRNYSKIVLKRSSDKMLRTQSAHTHVFSVNVCAPRHRGDGDIRDGLTCSPKHELFDLT
ncbi:hypothetical protein EVAR_26797_1 [Eumeta japonica]|uniref:Uncharacterized protein n=1 Tax=Eumeta variegata TaxID=151549 RepID=A0A4C1WFB1_EUMVA|nr:hypothetical protein EVAR_26797_1 [Eumeta japonica]